MPHGVVPGEVTPPGVAARDAEVRLVVGPRLAWLTLALVATAAIVVASVAFGTRVVGLAEIGSAFTGTEDGIAQAAVLKRIPRTILALLVGAALGLAGTVLQGVTRNPLADPAILGISPGAALAVVVGLAFFGVSSPFATIWLAIAGATASAVFVYAVGSLGRGGATPLKLALAGAATSAAFTSMVSAILLPRIDVMQAFRFWQIGGVGGASFAKIGLLVPFVLVGGLVCLAAAGGLNSLALGDDLAAGLGERVATTRLFAAAGAVILCGAATAVAGPIGFVGLVVPHLCRLLVGLDHRWSLPSAALVGAGLLTAADVLGRVVARPEEVDVGIVTALLGAPVFIAIVRRQKPRAL
ncbi:FecCD family ABC transporter permease [Egicoccus sp. AB-alg6-2]|uniref:FecCD family ABC transporter permease n=1 Tax=Egicoccus sp. AB-alg6-2 TaxID=3242692 RepID=UPI00359EBDD7